MADSQDEGANKQAGILATVHGFVDSNIQLIRNGLYVVCGLGVIIIGRSIHVTRVFKHAHDIPAKFIQNHIRLLGNAREISDEGLIQVQHIPPIKIPFTRLRTDKHLPVKLACLDISPDGRLWLRDNVKDNRVWFRLLHRDSHILHCSVVIPRVLRNININESLMKKGLCKVSSRENLQSEFSKQLTTDTTLLQYLDRMVYLENRAANKGAGMWKVNNPLEGTWRTKSVQAVKTVVWSPFRLVNWIYEKVKKRKKDS